MAYEERNEEGKLGRDWLKGTDSKSFWLSRWLKQANGWQRIWFVQTCLILIFSFVGTASVLYEGTDPVDAWWLFGLAVLSSGLLYLLGWTIGWIVKGFRSK